jgi:hypothetical protein
MNGEPTCAVCGVSARDADTGLSGTFDTRSEKYDMRCVDCMTPEEREQHAARLDRNEAEVAETMDWDEAFEEDR